MVNDAAAFTSAAGPTHNASGGIINQRLEHNKRGNTWVWTSTLSDGSLSPTFHLFYTREGGATYPNRTPWPPATSGCRKSWLWWSHNGRSSWWRGRWKSASSRCHLPRPPSSAPRSSALQLEGHSASGIPPDCGWHSTRRNPAQQGKIQRKKNPTLTAVGCWEHDGCEKQQIPAYTGAILQFFVLGISFNPGTAAAQFRISEEFLLSLTFLFSWCPASRSSGACEEEGQPARHRESTPASATGDVCVHLVFPSFSFSNCSFPLSPLFLSRPLCAFPAVLTEGFVRTAHVRSTHPVCSLLTRTSQPEVELTSDWLPDVVSLENRPPRF